MKHLWSLIVISFLLSSCGSGVSPLPAQNSASTTTTTPSSTAALSPPEAPAFTPTPLPLPDGISIQIGEGVVTQKDISEIKEALGLIHSYFMSTFGDDPALTKPFSVTVIGVGANNQAPGDLKGQCCGHMVAGKPGLFFDVQHPIWLQGDIHIPGNPVMHHLHNVAHEYTHHWQEVQGCFSTPGNPDPRPMRWWVSEGMAEYLSAASLVKAGKLTWDQADHAWQLADAQGAPYTQFPSLKTMEFDFKGWDYSFAYLAIERLVKQAPRGVLSLRIMCQDAAKGMDYSKAFQDAFGQSVDAFYTEFPVYAQKELGLNFPAQATNTPVIPSARNGFDNSFCADFTSSGDIQVECVGRYYIPSYASVEYHFKVIGYDLAGMQFTTDTVSSTCFANSWYFSSEKSTLSFDMNLNLTNLPIKCIVSIMPPGSGKTVRFTFAHSP